MLEGTPTKTPRSLAPTSNAMLRRSPRNTAGGAPHQHLVEDHEPQPPDTPFTRSINQLLAENTSFVAPPTPSRHSNNTQLPSYGYHFTDDFHPFVDDDRLLNYGNPNTGGFALNSPLKTTAGAAGPSSQAGQLHNHVAFNDADGLWARLNAVKMAGSMARGNNGHSG